MSDMTNTDRQEFDVVVIGAGPAGIMASAAAAGKGDRTLLLERNDAIGKKLKLAGGGRCNISTVVPQEDFLKAFGRDGQFLRSALAAFGPEQLTEFLAEGDVTLIYEGVQCFIAGGGNRLIEGLRKILRQRQVTVLCDQQITQIQPQDDGMFQIITQTDRFVARKKVILTTGGKSYPSLGSTGQGLTIASQLGHHITNLTPAMGPVRIQESYFENLPGISLPEVEVDVLADGKREGTFTGGFLITHHGISGPAILNASLTIARAIQKNKSVTLKINFLPAVDEKDLWDAFQKFPTRFREMISRTADIEGKVFSQISKAHRHQLVQLLTQMKLTVVETGSWDECMVTVGGISLKEVDPRTMESKIVKGLYLAGEILDLAGICGGYNIQAAFSTGFLAGNS